nr:MAG: hypothetical protein H1BulkLitter4585_000002 [Mitovirus sp.]
MNILTDKGLDKVGFYTHNRCSSPHLTSINSIGSQFSHTGAAATFKKEVPRTMYYYIFLVLFGLDRSTSFLHV